MEMKRTENSQNILEKEQSQKTQFPIFKLTTNLNKNNAVLTQIDLYVNGMDSRV